MREITTKEKLDRLLIKYPELRGVLRDLYKEESGVGLLKSLMSECYKKIAIVGRASEKLALKYELAHIMKDGYLSVKQVSTIDLLEYYLGESEEEGMRLAQLSDDLVMIKDSRAYVPNKQKPNFVSQVFEQNERVIYYYQGTQVQFRDDMQVFEQYCKDNGIKIITLERGKKQGAEDII